jgi:hypothetical protein
MAQLLKHLLLAFEISILILTTDTRELSVGMSTLQIVVEARELLKSNDLVVLGLFGDGGESTSARSALRSVSFSNEFNGLVAFADSTAPKVIEQFGKKEAAELPSIRLFRSFDKEGMPRLPGEPLFEVLFKGSMDYGSIKSFIFAQFLRPLLTIGGLQGVV